MNPALERALLAIWIGGGAIGLLAAAAVFVWAVRSGQFREQGRARSLALAAGEPEDGRC